MLKPFTVIFYKGQSPISKFIKRITKSDKYSHVALVLDNLHLLQLDWKTPVTIKHFNYSVDEYDIYELTFELTEQEKELLLQYLKEKVNTTYDWKFIISRFFNFIFDTPIINSKSRYNCDELIWEAFAHIGIVLNAKDIKMSPEILSKSKLLNKLN